MSSLEFQKQKHHSGILSKGLGNFSKDFLTLWEKTRVYFIIKYWQESSLVNSFLRHSEVSFFFFWLSWRTEPWTLVDEFLCGCMFWFLLDVDLGVWLRGHRVALCLAFWGMYRVLNTRRSFPHSLSWPCILPISVSPFSGLSIAKFGKRSVST